MTKYYFIKNGKKQGPFSKEELSRQPISAKTLVWFHPLDDWTLLSDLPELCDIDRMAANEKKEKPINVWAVMIGLSILISIVQFWPSSGNKDASASSKPEYYYTYEYHQISTSAIDSDVDFDMYVEKFYRDALAMEIILVRPKTTIIKLAPLNQVKRLSHFHGVSFGANDDERIEIYIDSISWEKFNKPMRYVLMYHELAHDLLNLKDLDYAELNGEKQLMFPGLSSLFANFTMDEFIESYQKVFTEYKLKNP